MEKIEENGGIFEKFFTYYYYKIYRNTYIYEHIPYIFIYI